MNAEVAGPTGVGGRRERVRIALLAGGPAAFLLYVALDAACSLLYDGYSYRDQTISELSATGAETRRLWLAVGIWYGPLTAACAAGMWMSARESRPLRTLALLVAAMACVSLFAWPFAPMHQREVLAAGGGTASDTAHLVLGAVNSLLFLSAMCISIIALRGNIRLFTIGALITVTVGGVITFALSPGVADNEATTGLGIAERIAVMGSMFWIGVVAIYLMLADPSPADALDPAVDKARVSVRHQSA
jgi:hypothetical protein